jgi:hypothetical protein
MGESSEAASQPPSVSAAAGSRAVFLSYASPDAEMANQVCQYLESHGGAQRQFELTAVIGAELDGNIGDGDQQGVLVGGDELAFRQQTLNVTEKGDLLGWGGRRRACGAHFEGFLCNSPCRE